MMLSFLIIFATLAFLAALGVLFAPDTRDGADWRRDAEAR